MDNIISRLIKKEVDRQANTLDLIPSENIADPEMLSILGSPLTNKYSEGYARRRYYPGNEFYDAIEELAIERALKAFKLSTDEWGVNVQPYSGSPANQAIYFALAKPGDVIMGLSLSHGGHLTHGHLVNFSGILYQSLPYTLDLKTGYIDYENLEKLAKEHAPKIIFSGATAYPRVIDFKCIGEIAKKVGAYHAADISHIAGLVAAGEHPSPFSARGGQAAADVVMATTHKTLRGPRGAVIWSKNRKIGTDAKGRDITIPDAINKAVFPGLQGGPHNNVTAAIAWMFGQVATPKFKAYGMQIVKNAKALAGELKKQGFSLVSGGTDNHLMLLDLRDKNISGSDAEKMLESSGIIANRNSIPGDDKPFKPSGVRMGTPAITSRGMKEGQMKFIANFIHDCLIGKKNVKKSVEALCKKFPLPYRR